MINYMKRILSTFLLCFLAIAINANAADNQPQQDGEGYYLIGTADQLLWFNRQAAIDSSLNVKLTADINMDGCSWIPIPLYVGTFDGQHHVISHLRIELPEVESVGFFSKFVLMGVESGVIATYEVELDLKKYSEDRLFSVCGDICNRINNLYYLTNGEITQNMVDEIVKELL